MADSYRIFGAEISPYSIKVRSYFRYKGIPHDWVIRNPSNIEEYQQYARLPLVPLVITPDKEGMQDSTPIIEEMERRVPEPSIYTGDPTLDFIGALIEEYGDEWGNKHMFHYRWWREIDQQVVGARLVQGGNPDLVGEELEARTKAVVERMVPRLSFVGSSDVTKEQIESSWKHELELLEPHFAGGRLYLFGARPSFADFGLFSQIHQASTDPTAGEIIREIAPLTLAWAERMLEPANDGEFQTWEALAPTLEPLLSEQIATLFLPWTDANTKALAAGDEIVSVDLPGGTWTQGVQKYHARSLAALRAKYAALDEKAGVDAILSRTGCLEWIAA